MLFGEIIDKKRLGGVLTSEEMKLFVFGSLDGTVTKEQTGAMLMALLLKGMSTEEAAHMTMHMVATGDYLTWPAEMSGKLVDKHSTGGVGDKISLLLAPALAACGLKVPMISGRSLGITGGTLDKLEAIPGFQVSRTMNEIREQVAEVGCAIVGQTGDLVPADKYLYAVRDTTATTNSTHLIAASIMSKKMAESLDALVMEITYGRASFLQTEEQARHLAEILIPLGNSVGTHVSVCLTTMDQPLGKMIGNVLEVLEVIQCFRGGDIPGDIMEMYLKLGSCSLCDMKVADSYDQAVGMLQEVLRNGTACQKFQDMIVAQGVDRELASGLFKTGIDPTTLLPSSKLKTDLPAAKSGCVHDIDAMICAETCRRLGAGRNQPTDVINYAVGIELLCQVGTEIKKGEPWVRIHHDKPLDAVLSSALSKAIVIDEQHIQPPNRIIEIIRADTTHATTNNN